MICSKALPDGGVEKYRLRRNVRVTRQIRAKLCLNKCVGGEELIKSRECFKRCGPASETARPIAGGQNSAAKQAQNRTCRPHNRVRLQARKHHPLHAQRGIPNAAIPGVIQILKVDRNIDLDLISYPEALLMNHVSRAP